jgi:four helix bundle protein
MATFKKFEDIQVWQKGRELTRQIYSLTPSVAFSKDYGLANQLRRASVSIMANIAEGHGRHADTEFAHYLNLAHGSAAEVQSHLYVALDLCYIEEADFSRLYEALDEISRMTFSLQKLLRARH